MESYEAAVSILREFGFPVFVATWFMWRLERRLDRIFDLMGSHMQATAVLAKSVEDHQRRPALRIVPAPKEEGEA